MTSSSSKLVEELPAGIRKLLDESPDAVLLVDRSGEIVALSRRAEELFGTPAARLRGRPVEVLVPPRLREGHAAARASYMGEPTVRRMSARPGLAGFRADGSEFDVEIALAPIAGSAEGLVMAVVHEVGPRAGPMLDALADAVITTDGRGQVAFLNRAAEALTGHSLEHARGRPLTEVLPLRDERTGERLPDPAAACLRGGESGSREALLDDRVLDISTAPIRDSAGAPVGSTLMARDITHARLLARELAHQASHDALTGLVNRTEFERRLARLRLGAESGGEHALCFIDLDGFKRVNDACGHLAGDELLRQLSTLMRDRMRSRDTLARLGGDEFGVLLEHCRLPRARRIADNLRRAVGAHRFTCADRTHVVGASVGIVPLRAGAGSARDLLAEADAACYAAKRRGGNRVVIREPGEPADLPVREPELMRRLERALEEDRFLLHAQPVAPLGRTDDRAPRYELLLRLAEAGELLAPALFLPVARRHGLMPAIDRWVVRHAAGRLASHRERHPGIELPTVAVNLADDTVAGDALLETLRTALGDFGLDPRVLCFEIAESAAVTHPTRTAEVLAELRAVGCQATIEHGGSSMAAFTVLRRLPLDYLKIAGHLVLGVVDDPVDRALTGALNEVGHALGLRTIAIQVENRRILEWLRGMGVDFVQGYGIAEPEPLDQALGRHTGAPA